LWLVLSQWKMGLVRTQYKYSGQYVSLIQGPLRWGQTQCPNQKQCFMSTSDKTSSIKLHLEELTVASLLQEMYFLLRGPQVHYSAYKKLPLLFTLRKLIKSIFSFIFLLILFLYLCLGLHGVIPSCRIRSRSYFTTDGQILLPVGMLLSEICGLVSVGRPLWWNCPFGSRGFHPNEFQYIRIGTLRRNVWCYH
jgi:hypothetical protein